MYDANRSARLICPEDCRAMRERLNWTRAKLAKVSGLPLWYLEAFENGEEIPLILASFQTDLHLTLEFNTKYSRS
jgi:DNA-binding transcriptional regulator YiaG